jgi:hypothetical protein
MVNCRTVALAAAALAPALLTVFLSFNGGGFFAGAPALVAVALGIALILRITLAEDPLAGVGKVLAVAIGALGLYAVWVLASASWSDAPARAMIEFDRVLAYWLALVFFATLPRDDRRLAWAIRALAVAMVAVALTGLLSRLLPEVVSVESVIESDRLSYPLTYWNGLGAFVGIAIVFCLHLSSSLRETRVVRALAAGAIPVLAATLYFTFSRGGMLTAIVGVVAYTLVARPRGLPGALLAALPPAVVAVLFCYRSDALSSEWFVTPAGIDEGGQSALVIAACVAAAILLRVVAARIVDRRMERLVVTPSARRRGIFALALAVPIALLVATVALDAPGRVADQYQQFVDGSGVENSDDLRGRLTSIGNNGRLAHWEVSLDAFSANPVRGSGAGTYVFLWARDSRENFKVEDAHSLYVEVLGELGLVGLVLILVALGALIGGLAWTARGSRREPLALLFAAGLAWAVHAGIDWDWELPAVGLWLFALGGLALAGPAETSARLARGRLARVALGAGCLALIVTPLLVGLSQRELNDAVAALKAGDCGVASRSALDAARLVPARPQPYQILGYCNSRVGNADLAEQMLRTAIRREPDSWESYYGLALVRAAAGRNPRPAVREALRRSPQEPLVLDAVDRFDTDNPQEWRRRATNARLPIL